MDCVESRVMNSATVPFSDDIFPFYFVLNLMLSIDFLYIESSFFFFIVERAK
jgi:hypothetical protein